MASCDIGYNKAFDIIMTKQEIRELIADTMVGQGNQVDLGGKLPQILNSMMDAAPLVTEFVPKVALETEEIGLSEANVKYGLTDEVFGKMSKGEIDWLSLGATDASKRLRIVVREADKYILCGDVDGETDYQASITMTEDGKFNIVIPS